jgi:hypothetical protein
MYNKLHIADQYIGVLGLFVVIGVTESGYRTVPGLQAGDIALGPVW